MKRLRYLPILMIAALLAMVSCDGEKDIDRAYTDYRYDIVTYLGENGTGAVFEYLGHGDSAAVRLQSRVSVDEVKTNQRVLLRYDFADERTGDGRDINVYGCNAIISDSLRQSQTSPDSLSRHQVKLRSLWRTGGFINLHCQVEYTNHARSFMLVADAKTLASDTVDCYLVHDLRGENGTFWRDCYASFYVGVLWNKDSFKCLRLHLNDVTYPLTEYYDFIK
ncbi:MAG: hypothetical protein IKZ92_06050 [Muribaculaceae bacterium]|nr:hypothetical protein [Muribaculaceae bacterium]